MFFTSEAIWIMQCLVRTTFLVVLLILGSNAQAAERELGSPRSKLDVVLLFDASGSMLKTDTQDLRYQGAKLLLSFLGEGDRLGIVQFAGEAKVLQKLEPFAANRSKLMTDRIDGIKAEGQFTDIAEGVKVSASILDESPRPEVQRAIVLLSDGKVEPDPKVGPAFARTLEMVHDVLPELKAKEIKVFTLCFSDGADRAFLGEIAAATDGLTWFTQSVEDIHKSFAELFLAMKRPQVVPQSGRGFTVDTDVTEATFYINHNAGELLKLISPKGNTYSAEKHPEIITWFVGKNFDVVTITEPESGVWQVAGTESHDGFATVMTDLKLLTDWPLTIRSGDEPLVQARLYDREKPISLPEMSGVLKLGFQIVPTDKVSAAVVQEALNDSGVRGDKIALDGIFSSVTAPMQTGSYKLSIVAKGPTFQRSQQIPFTVLPRLVSLEVRKPAVEFDNVNAQGVAPGVGGDAKVSASTDKSQASSAQTPIALTHGDEESEFVVVLSKEASGFRKIEVELVGLTEDREKVVIPMKRAGTNSRQFELKAGNLPRDDTYKLKAIMRAEVKKGETLTAESLLVSFRLTSTAPRTPKVEERAAKQEEKPEDKTSTLARFGLPIAPLAIASLCNAAVLAFILLILGKRGRRPKVVAQKYFPHKQLLDAVAALEERSAASSIDFGDPLLQPFEARKSGEDGVIDSGAERQT